MVGFLSDFSIPVLNCVRIRLVMLIINNVILDQ